MSIQINSVSSFVNSSVSTGISQKNEQLSNGSRINSAADDAAGLQISDRLTSGINGNHQAVSNIINGSSLLQTASGGLNQINDNLQQLRELGIQAGNGTLNDNDRAAIQQQANGILQSIQDTISSTTFGGEELLTKDSSLSFQAGAESGNNIDVDTYNVDSQLNTAGLYNVDFTNLASLTTSLTSIDTSLENIGVIQSEYGAQQNAFSSRVDSLLNAQENETAARSRIKDTDYAATVSDQIIQSILEKSSVSVQAQANISNTRALSLLTP
ncbi:flagellin [Marinomonas sp. 15G1-11]|uniref:Flagellin n=1 Tax=Marinomonas phaeophyticola TaxID=3004091 RepID=A0ABT4JSU5_9GAMM|nr:flagellin [Marinomonas sp. 15G1-11]MCZ2720674.1 flagellin [Marinomonas sp. 15G1-11]